MPISATHWGTFAAEARADGTLEIQAFAKDPCPSPMIGSVAEYRTHETRILRPAVRKGWLEGRAGEWVSGRGSDPFVEVDWDTALDLVARELDRIRSLYGNTSLFAGSYGWSSAGRFHHAKMQLKRFINTIGGCVEQVNNYSFGAAMVLLPHVLGNHAMLYGRTTGWDAILSDTELFVSFGGLPDRNGQIESGGVGAHVQEGFRSAFRAKGGRLVNISPLRSDAPGASEWLPIRPGTDAALLLALCHEIDRQGLADEEFLGRYTVGIETFRTYLRTGNDGRPFGAAWAAGVTGLPEDRIRALATEMAGCRCFLNLNWSLQRAEFGEQPFWAAIALASMLGQIGLAGGGFGFGYGSMNGTGNPVRRLPSPSLPTPPNPTGAFIPVARVTDLLLGQVQEMDYDGQKLTLPAPRLVYWAGGNPFHHHQDLNRLLEGWTRPETIVVQDHVWTATARHADIVLPASMGIERDDIATSSNDRYLVAMARVAPPPGEARDDYWIFTELARRLNVEQAFTEGRSADEWIEHLYESTRAAVGAQGIEMPDYAAWRRAGVFEKPLGETPYNAFEAFRCDPDAAPLATASGRIEIFCKTISDFGYADCLGHPSWFPPREGLGAPRARRYPLHLLTTQPRYRLHGQLDPVEPSLGSKINGREPLRMHPAAAAARGLQDGDIVRVSNDRGACLAGLVLTEDLLPEVVEMSTGAWYDPIHPGLPGCLEVHGNPNVLTHDRPSSSLSQGPAAQSCLVEVESWRAQLPPIRVRSAPGLVTGRLTTPKSANPKPDTPSLGNERAISPHPTGEQQ